MDSNSIIIYTDGSCPNNGRGATTGGWAYLIQFPDGSQREAFGPLTGTKTNNRAEMTALLMALLYLEAVPDYDLILRSDSQYVGRGVTEWMERWRHNQWRKADHKQVENTDLWIDLYSQVAARHGKMEYEFIRGHNGDETQEWVDTLAVRGAQL